MILCDNGHEEICYECGDCPMCKKIAERENLEWEILDLNDEIDELRRELGNLTG